jgi:hypothetical protein
MTPDQRVREGATACLDELAVSRCEPSLRRYPPPTLGLGELLPRADQSMARPDIAVKTAPSAGRVSWGIRCGQGHHREWPCLAVQRAMGARGAPQRMAFSGSRAPDVVKIGSAGHHKPDLRYLLDLPV